MSATVRKAQAGLWKNLTSEISLITLSHSFPSPFALSHSIPFFPFNPPDSAARASFDRLSAYCASIAARCLYNSDKAFTCVVEACRRRCRAMSSGRGGVGRKALIQASSGRVSDITEAT